MLPDSFAKIHLSLVRLKKKQDFCRNFDRVFSEKGILANFQPVKMTTEITPNASAHKLTAHRLHNRPPTLKLTISGQYKSSLT